MEGHNFIKPDSDKENQGEAAAAGAKHVDARRGAKRFNLMIRPAKLVAGEAEFLCVLRDVSATGVAVKLFHQLPDALLFELVTMTGDRIEMEKVWERDGGAGFHFRKEIDVEQFVGEKGPYRKRPVRLHLELDGEGRTLSGKFPVQLINISSNGVQILCKDRLALAQRLTLQFPKLPEMTGSVRWRRDDHYGIALQQNWQMGELARMAARLHGVLV